MSIHFTPESFYKLVETNIILKSDAYKHSHFLQYPPNTTKMYSYIESRGGRFDKTVFFGLQMFIKRYMLTPITQEQIDYAAEVAKGNGIPFNRVGWERILEKHNGYLPLVIKAVKEGAVIDTKNVLVTVENKDPEVAWLTSFIETPLLRAVWYPVTVATGSWAAKQVIKRRLEMTSDDPEGQLPFNN